MNRVFLALILLGFATLVFPVGLVSPAAAENPTNANVYAGDAHAIGANVIGDRHFAWRIVNDATNPSHRSGWEIAPGAGIAVYFRYWCPDQCIQLPSGDAADYCRLQTYWDNSATIQRTVHSATTCPGQGSSTTIYCTDNGLVGGTPIAGTIRLRIEARETTGGIPTYTADSDSLDRGAIRCGFTATTMSHGGYPTGSTYAYTVAGENIGVSMQGTRGASGQTSLSVQFRLLDGATQFATTGNLNLATSGASPTSGSFTVSDSMPAAAIVADLRFVVVGISGLTGVKFTHIHSAAAPLTVIDDATVSDGGFNIDARITATHLLQVNSNTFASPPMSMDIGDTRTLPDTGYYATRFTNARGEGLTGSSFAYTRTVQDDGATIPADTLTCASSCIGTQGGETGWSPLFLWNAGGPLGQWNKNLDITAPATIDANTHLVNAAEIWFLELPESGSGFGNGTLIRFYRENFTEFLFEEYGGNMTNITIDNNFPDELTINSPNSWLHMATTLPIVLFVGLIIWAENKRDPLLYVLAILTGVIVVIGLNVATEVRSVLVAVIMLVAWRLFTVRQEIMEQD